MDAPTAALIGAGVAATVSLVGQFLGHALSIQRDRRNQRRASLYTVIAQAAAELYGPDKRPKPDPDEPPPKPGTIAAMYRIPLPVRALQEGVARGITMLQIHFGHDHPLLDSYVEAAQVCTEAMHAFHEMLEDDEQGETPESKARVEEIAKLLRKAQIARDAWMTEARAVVDRI
jgi:hypothetical protein